MDSWIHEAIQRGVDKQRTLREQLDDMHHAVYKWAEELQGKGARPEEVHLLVSDIIETWHEQGNCDRLSCNLVMLYIDEWLDEQEVEH